jgi:hypothetical protein
MSGQEAQKILQKPVFGDQRCIQARDTLLVLEAMKKEGPVKMDVNVDLETYRCLLEDGSL